MSNKNTIMETETIFAMFSFFSCQWKWNSGSVGFVQISPKFWVDKVTVGVKNLFITEIPEYALLATDYQIKTIIIMK